MRKVVWFALGAAVAVVVVLKGRELLRKTTPAGVREQVSEKSSDAMKAASAFVTTFRSAMTERESELRDALGITAAHEAAAPVRPAAAPARAARA